MPRIPSKSNDSASSIWKMNDVYVARNGDEWPEFQLPPVDYYMPRAYGGAVALTGGVGVTNAYVHSQFPTLGSAYTTGPAYWQAGTWNYTGPRVEALGFNVTNNWGASGTYAITGLGLGAFNAVSGYFGNAGAMGVKVTDGLNTANTTLWHWDIPTTWTVELRGQGQTGVSGCQVVEFPTLDTSGNPMALTFGNWYTIMFIWYGSNTWNGWPSSDMVSAYGSNTLAVPSGTLSTSWANVTFGGSSPYNSSNGTSASAGQMQIFRITF